MEHTSYMNTIREFEEALLFARTAEAAVISLSLNLEIIEGNITRAETQGDHRYLRQLLWDKDRDSEALLTWTQRLIEGRTFLVEAISMRALGGRLLPAEIVRWIVDLLL